MGHVPPACAPRVCGVVPRGVRVRGGEPQQPPLLIPVPTGTPTQLPTAPPSLRLPHPEYSLPTGNPGLRRPRARGGARPSRCSGGVQGTRTPPLVANGGTPPTVLCSAGRAWMRICAAGCERNWASGCATGRTRGCRGVTSSWPLGQTLVADSGPPHPTRRSAARSSTRNTGLPVFERGLRCPALGGFVTVSSATTGVMGADALLRAPVVLLHELGNRQLPIRRARRIPVLWPQRPAHDPREPVPDPPPRS